MSWLRSFLMKFLWVVLLSVMLNSIAQAKPVIERWTTQTGVPVYFVHRPELPIVDIDLLFRAGSAYGSHPDVAALTAMLLDQGTSSLTAEQIAERLESVAAQYHIAVDADKVSLTLRALSEPKQLDSALDTFRALTFQANFPEKAVERIKKQQQMVRLEQQQNPAYLANQRFIQTLYRNHPYARAATSTPQTIAAVSRTDLVNFYRRYYVASNAGIAIVGAIDKSTAQALAEKLTAHLPKGAPAPALPTPTPYPKADTLFVDHPSQQTTVILGQLGVLLTDPDYPALSLGNQILGGGILTSRLFEEVRNKRGLAYGVRSHFSIREQTGPFTLWLQTRNDQANTALTVAKTTLRDFIKNGPTEKEINAAKQAIIGADPLSIASNEGILSRLAGLVFYHLPTDYTEQYLSKIQKLTLAEIQHAFNKVINPEKLLTVEVGPHSPHNLDSPR
jgi:zinc protease